MSNITENGRTIKFLLLLLTMVSFSTVVLRLIDFSYNITPHCQCPSNCTIYGPLDSGGVSWGLNSSHKQIPGSSAVSKDGLEAIKAFNWTFNTFKETTYVCFSPKRVRCNSPPSDNESSNIGLSIIALVLEVVTFLVIFCSLFLFGTWTSTPLYHQSF